MLIDAGSGLGAGAGILGAASDQVVIVSTPEPTSLADAHAAIAWFHQQHTVAVRVLVNQAQVARRDRGARWNRPTRAGSSRGWSHRCCRVCSRVDPHVPMAVRSGVRSS